MGIYVAITSAPPNAAEAFSTAIYREQVPPDQYAVTFFRLIGDWQTAGVRIDALGARAIWNRMSRPFAMRRNKLTRPAISWKQFACLTRSTRRSGSTNRNFLNTKRSLPRKFIYVDKAVSPRRTRRTPLALALADLRHTDAAHLIAERIDLSQEDLEKRFALALSQQEEFYVSGRDKGLNADLIVAIEIARLAVDRGRTSGERTAALHNLAVSLATHLE